MPTTEYTSGLRRAIATEATKPAHRASLKALTGALTGASVVAYPRRQR
jgi:hypothetical protein